jgi:hypothetical protein
MSQARAKVEHPFRPFKSIFGFTKARYRWPMKNANHAFALRALINTEKWGLPLTGQMRQMQAVWKKNSNKLSPQRLDRQ